jgi:3-oxoacyl-(acyl-carrier-protein) synthase
VAEADALRRALGEYGRSVPVVSLTGGIGNLFAGAGGVALAAGALALHRQVIPPAVNGEQPDPECGLNLPPGPAEGPLRHVLCAACAVGGQSGAVVLRAGEA